MIIWRGLGVLVLVIPIVIWLAIVFTMMGFDYYEPDTQKAAAMAYRTFAAGCVAGLLVLWPLVRRRNRTAPGVDHLAFVPMRYWLPILAVVAAAAVAASFIPAALRIV
jgi:peptidoglycan biosynthesis protein MviN/MurJ (putative lipid II flippase)